jgi:hypothetical protein
MWIKSMDSLRLDSLQEVSKSLTICNMDQCSQAEYTNNSLAISLPSLQLADAMYINGLISGCDFNPLPFKDGHL